MYRGVQFAVLICGFGLFVGTPAWAVSPDQPVLPNGVSKACYAECQQQSAVFARVCAANNNVVELQNSCQLHATRMVEQCAIDNCNGSPVDFNHGN